MAGVVTRYPALGFPPPDYVRSRRNTETFPRSPFCLSSRFPCWFCMPMPLLSPFGPFSICPTRLDGFAPHLAFAPPPLSLLAMARFFPHPVPPPSHFPYSPRFLLKAGLDWRRFFYVPFFLSFLCSSDRPSRSGENLFPRRSVFRTLSELFPVFLF